jgi:hypothetical protein
VEAMGLEPTNLLTASPTGPVSACSHPVLIVTAGCTCDDPQLGLVLSDLECSDELR